MSGSGVLEDKDLVVVIVQLLEDVGTLLANLASAARGKVLTIVGSSRINLVDITEKTKVG